MLITILDRGQGAGLVSVALSMVPARAAIRLDGKCPVLVYFDAMRVHPKQRRLK
jgi:hypothetical protein